MQATSESLRSSCRPFGQVESGGGTVDASLFELESERLRVRATDFGAALVAVETQDREGSFADILLGYDAAASYGKRGGPYLGSVVGRYANRIAKGRFELDDEIFELPINNGPNSLHGGLDGLSRVPWEGELLRSPSGHGVEFRHTSPHGAEGYPGEVDIVVRYRLAGETDLIIEAEASTDRPTVLNLSYHGYFNLAGHDSGDILEHEVRLQASHYTPVDEDLIPTGEIAPVDGTPMDLRSLTPVGRHIDANFEQLTLAGGYDHNWVIDRTASDGEPALAGTVRDPRSGRQLEVLTTQPGVQFYAGNFLDGSIPGKGGANHGRRCGLCLETQHFPDSPNQPSFPSTVLRPGELYRHVTIYRFSADGQQQDGFWDLDP